MAQRLTDNNDTTPALADLVADLAELFARVEPIVGTYTPTLTGVANVAASTPNSSASYVRTGSVVRVSGTIQIDPTAASVATTIGISLPIASNFTSFTQLSGRAARVQGTIGPLVAGITADSTNDRAQMTFLNDTDVADRSWAFEFTYLIV